MRPTQHSASSWLAVLAILCSTALASAQTFDISWFTIDGGGEMFTTGGDFELSGTIGQPDAGAMTGGDFELVGGFWPGTGGRTCDACDMNCDGDINAFDIEPFLTLLFDPNAPPCCGERGVGVFTGDVNGDGVINAFDIEPFLECLFP